MGPTRATAALPRPALQPHMSPLSSLPSLAASLAAHSRRHRAACRRHPRHLRRLVRRVARAERAAGCRVGKPGRPVKLAVDNDDATWERAFDVLPCFRNSPGCQSASRRSRRCALRACPACSGSRSVCSCTPGPARTCGVARIADSGQNVNVLPSHSHIWGPCASNSCRSRLACLRVASWLNPVQGSRWATQAC